MEISGWLRCYNKYGRKCPRWTRLAAYCVGVTGVSFTVGVISELGLKGGLGFCQLGLGRRAFHVGGVAFTGAVAWTGVAGSGRVATPADCGDSSWLVRGWGWGWAGEGGWLLEALVPPCLLWAHLFFLIMSTRGQARKGSQPQRGQQAACSMCFPRAWCQ